MLSGATDQRPSLPILKRNCRKVEGKGRDKAQLKCMMCDVEKESVPRWRSRPRVLEIGRDFSWMRAERVALWRVPDIYRHVRTRLFARRWKFHFLKVSFPDEILFVPVSRMSLWLPNVWELVISRGRKFSRSCQRFYHFARKRKFSFLKSKTY